MSQGVEGWFCLASEPYWIGYLFFHLFGIKEGGSVVLETAVMSETAKDWVWRIVGVRRDLWFCSSLVVLRSIRGKFIIKQFGEVLHE